MSTVKANVRLIIRELRVPYDADDPARAELVDTLIEKSKEVRAQELLVDKLKKGMKPIIEERDAAMDELMIGKVADVDCDELFIWDRNEVRVRRKDTGETIEVREMTETDRQTSTFDQGEQRIQLDD